MTLLQLRYVLTIAECGSMNRAAERLYVSQPTMTSAIRELENEIGIAIFHRISKGVTPTAEGEEFLRYASQVCYQYELLESKYGDKKKSKRKFGISSQHYSFVDKAFVEMVRKFGTLNYEFALRESKTAEVISDVGSLRSEIGVLFQSEYNRKILNRLFRDNDLEFHKLIECQACVYLWKGHPLAGETSIGLEQLMDYPCLSFEQGSQPFFLAEEILTEKEYPRIIYTTDRATSLNLMVGLNGYTLCSGIICEELNGTDFLTIPYRGDGDGGIMEIGYIQKRNVDTSEFGQVFLDEMRRYLAGQA